MSMNASPELYQIPPELSGVRLDAALAQLLADCSRSRIQQWIADGRVQVNGADAPGRLRLKGGEQVSIARPAVLDGGNDVAEDLGVDIVHADADLLVINKPAGLVVHPGAGNPRGTLVNALLHHAPELASLPRAGIVHRLDKDTSGLLLVARTALAHRRLVAQMAAREIRREYLALVQGELVSGGSVDAPIGRHRTDRVRMAVSAGGRPAVTHYRVVRRLRRHTLLRVTLETGRTHQIRVHLASIGHPVAGDRTYGRAPVPPPGCAPELLAALQGLNRQALHATALALVHPVSGTNLQLSAPLPAALAGLFEMLVADARSA